MNILILTMGSQFGYITEHYYYCKYLKINNKLKVLSCDLGFEKVSIKGVDVIYLKPYKNKHLGLISFYFKTLQICLTNRFDVTLLSYFRFSFLLRFLLPFQKLVLDIRTGSIGTVPQKVAKTNAKLRFESKFFKYKLINTHSLAEELKIKKYDCLPIGAVNRVSDSKTFDDLTLLYIGTLDKRRIEETLEGLSLFRNKYALKKQIRYDIVGFGEKETIQNVKNKIEELDLSNIVFFHGRKTIEELQDFFVNANIGIAYVPMIRCYQCQPALKTLEYLINGMPVIATKTDEMKRIVNDSNGILIEDTPKSFAEGLSELAEKRWNYDSATIKRAVEKYSWKNIVLNNLEPYLKRCSGLK